MHAVSESEKNRKQGLKRVPVKNEKKTEESVKVEVKNKKVLPLKRKTTFTWHERSYFKMSQNSGVDNLTDRTRQLK